MPIAPTPAPTPTHPPDSAGAAALRRLRCSLRCGLVAAGLALPAAGLHGQPAPAAAPPPAAAAAQDPVERLRERLADRLSGERRNPSGNAVDLRVVNNPPAAPRSVPDPAPRRAAPATAAPAPARGGKAASKPATAPWSYQGDSGPQAWGTLRPEYGLCAKGERQSPIDLRDGFAVDLDPIGFHYRSGEFSVIDNGHTVKVKPAPGNHMELGGRRFELQHFQFHRPSEHRIDGRQFEMSLHLVHRDPEGRLAVVAVQLGRGAAQSAMQAVLNNLPLERNQEARARVALDPSELLPQDQRYYTYMGSLTTPPCTEGVQWVVLRQPVSAAQEQIDIFSRLFPMNARPVQNAAGRRILQSN